MLTVIGLIGCVSLLYATAGQAWGTAFLAVMAFVEFPAAEMRATALMLNIVAAGYATWRLHRRAAIDLKILLPLTVPSLLAAFLGGLLVLGGDVYFILTGVLLIAAAVLTVFKRTADNVDGHPVRRGAATAVGAGAGFISGLTGVGGGVFMTPLLIAFGWASPRRAAQLSPPFILCNSVLGLAEFCSLDRDWLRAVPSTRSVHLPERPSARSSARVGCQSVGRDMSLRPFCCSLESGCYSDRGG